MINATHYVIDLETMGKGPTAAIVAIGCVRIENLVITGDFYHRVPLRSSLEAGLQVDASTIEWWLEQEDAARAQITGGTTELPHALGWLAAFMGDTKHDQPDRKALLWGNGSSFDNVILGNAFDACGIPRPWLFWNDRDLRTLLALYPEAKALPFEGTKHHALHDALHEARQLIAALTQHANHVAVAPLIAPPGYILAPTEPTPAMVAAAEEAHMPFGDMHFAVQCALLAAQPQETTA